ncbi:restriction endonuclease [Streptomyces globisporus]|uniref:restriction endonuclease n=1 Tax=Streptomyces globisporus TaxID=1908 RepID=UPI00099BB018|nr:restriction endonuclease [Streptomyces globisporus]
MSRRPARRRRRTKAQTDPRLLGVAALVAVSLFMALVSWLAAHPWVVLLGLLAAAAGGALWLHRRQEAARWERVRAQSLRYAVEHLDGLHHTQFEYAVRDLMRRDGCVDAQQVGGRGDNGADVKATDPFGRRWVIQCKHRVRHEVALSSGWKQGGKIRPRQVINADPHARGHPW